MLVEYGLVLPFDDQSESFTLGFEAGGLYEQLRRGEVAIECTVHSSNHDLILRMCGKEGYSCELSATAYREWEDLRAVRLPGAHCSSTN